MKRIKTGLFVSIALLIGTNCFAERTYEKLCGTTQKACENGKCGFFENGHHTALVYTDVACLADGSLAVKQGTKWGIYDEGKDKTLSEIKYEEIVPLTSFLGRVYKVKAGGKWGVFAGNSEIVPPQYDAIEQLDKISFLKGLQKGKWAIIYPQVSHTQTYDSIEPATGMRLGGSNYYVVTVKGKKGVIWLNTRVPEVVSFIAPEFEEIEGPRWYDFVKVKQNKKWAFYNVEKKQTASAFYDGIEKADTGWMYVASAGKQGLLAYESSDKTLAEIVPPSFQRLKKLIGTKIVAVLQDGKWGVYKIGTKELVVPCKYDDIKGYTGTAVKVFENGQWTKLDVK